MEPPITREQLKREIDTLDTACLSLVYRVLRQFPHTHQHQKAPQDLQTQPLENDDKLTFSQRWRGKLSNAESIPEASSQDPRFAYLSERYRL